MNIIQQLRDVASYPDIGQNNTKALEAAADALEGITLLLCPDGDPDGEVEGADFIQAVNDLLENVGIDKEAVYAAAHPTDAEVEAAAGAESDANLEAAGKMLEARRPRALPIVEYVNGRRYYEDARLSEYREVEHPDVSYAFNSTVGRDIAANSKYVENDPGPVPGNDQIYASDGCPDLGK